MESVLFLLDIFKEVVEKYDGEDVGVFVCGFEFF